MNDGNKPTNPNSQDTLRNLQLQAESLDHDEQPTIADIIAEEHYQRSTDFTRKPKIEEGLSQATASLKNLSEELKLLQISKEKAHFIENNTTSLKPVDIAVGDKETFEAAFRPSRDFVRGDTEPVAEPEEAPHVVRKPSLWARWRRNVSIETQFASDADPLQVARSVGRSLKLMKLRCFLAFIVLLPLLYITLAQELPLPMADAFSLILHTYRFFGIIAGMQLLIMLIALDIIAEGLRQLFTLRPSRSFAVTISNFASLLFVACVLLFPNSGYAYIPLSAVCATTLVFALWAKYWDTAAYFRTFKTAGSMEQPTIIYRQENGYDLHGTFGRLEGDTENFVRQTLQKDQSSKMDQRLIPILSVAALVFSLLTSVGMGRPGQFPWCYSVLTIAVAPISIGLTFSLPWFFTSRYLSRFRACIAGWTAASSFSNDGLAVLTDGDIFPRGRVTLDGMAMFNDHSASRVLMQTASVLKASGSNLSLLLDDVLREMKLTERLHPVSNFEFYEEGGFSAEINHDRVLVGSGAFMLRMGVSLPKKLPAKTAIFSAVNMSLACIFPLQYVADRSVKQAVLKLFRNRIPPIFACRDFNITPKLLNEVMATASDHIEIPNVEQRLSLSSPANPVSIKPAALMERNDLVTYTECIISSIKLKNATRLNLFFHTLCTVGGLLLFFYLTYMNAAGSLLPHNILLFLGVFLLPIFLVSAFVNWH